MPKRTLKSICDEYGMTRDQLNYARAQGVNPFNDKELKSYLSNRRVKVDSKPATASQANSTDIDAGGMPTGTVEEIQAALAVATEYALVKTLKEKLEAMTKAVKLQKESRELVPLAEIEERDIRIASVVKAGILKLCNDSAPMSEGLEASKIHKVLMDQGVKILEMMADEQSEFWKEL